MLVMSPEVLLFDEPTAGLDPRTQSWLEDLIVELNASGTTIVHATHDLAALPRIATRCLVFSEDHRIVTSGTPGEVLADHDLLTATNLVHTHAHRHVESGRALVHRHEHATEGHHHA